MKLLRARFVRCPQGARQHPRTAARDMHRWRWIVALAALLPLVGGPAFAQVPVSAAQRAELRAAINAGRDAAEALYKQQVAECRTRFVVSSCVEAARKQRHETLKQLDRQQTALDDVEREERAIERREAIAKKQADEQARQAEARARQRATDAKRRAADERAKAPVAHERPARKSRELPSAQDRAAKEASARAAYALKQLQAEARRQEAARRNAEHAKKTNRAAPLPVPGDEAFTLPAPSGSAAAQAAPAASAPSSPAHGPGD